MEESRSLHVVSAPKMGGCSPFDVDPAPCQLCKFSGLLFNI